jgi:2'-hydroxyisoflavone reductase
VQNLLAVVGLAAITLAAGVSPAPANVDAPQDDKQLHILILGGTGFLGPATIEAALARGHRVTIFNSGRTEERRQGNNRPSVVPEGVEVLIGNRDPEKTADDRRRDGGADAEPDPNSPRGLTQLTGRSFDAVIDTSGYYPRMVRASAELLAPNVRQYLFISTYSVYADNAQAGADESALLATIEDPAVEEMGPNMSYYGALKALCEQAVEEAMPGRATILRPTFIVGPRDLTARFMYWPVRIAQGGEMPVPGEPEIPISVIDVRDLAEFAIHCIEEQITGTFNIGTPPMTMKEFVESIREGVGAETKFVFVGRSFAAAHGMGFPQYPLYIPDEGEYAGFHQRDVSKAVGAGLKFRPLSETSRATLAWYKELPADIQPRILPQGRLSPEREQEVLEAYRRSEGGR